MITSVAKFLDAFQQKQAEVLGRQSVEHAPTIGDMYEGLTRDILDRAIPPSLELRIIDGFAIGPNGARSNQCDVLLVMGNKGHPIPYTTSFEWPIEDVLAVIEVKKNLYGSDLADGMDKLRKIWGLQVAHFGNAKYKKEDLAPSARAFALLTGSHPDPNEGASTSNRQLLNVICAEQFAPVRVIWGYQGYANEAGLRKGLLDYLDPSAPTPQLLGPAVLPNLVVCRQNSIVKMTGHPYIAPINENGRWALLASARQTPLRILIELVWARLSNQFKTQFPSDDSLDSESLAVLAEAEFAEKQGVAGWAYYFVTVGDKKLQALPTPKWTPNELDIEEETLLSGAVQFGRVNISNGEYASYAEQNGLDARLMVQKLVEKRLMAWETDLEARPISSQIAIVRTPDGKAWASDNNELLKLWLADYGKT